MIGFIIVGLFVMIVGIVLCRLLAVVIRDVNRYDAGLPPRKGRHK